MSLSSASTLYIYTCMYMYIKYTMLFCESDSLLVYKNTATSAYTMCYYLALVLVLIDGFVSETDSRWSSVVTHCDNFPSTLTRGNFSLEILVKN